MKKRFFIIISCLTVSIISAIGCIGTFAATQVRTVNNLVIFVNFNGETESLPSHIVNNIEALYNTGYTNTYYSSQTNKITTSVKDYFAAASNGSLNVNTYIYKSSGNVAYAKDTQKRDIYRITYNKSSSILSGTGGTDPDTFIENKTSNIRTFISNAASKIGNAYGSVDVDTDGDGYVDCFTIIVSGYDTDSLDHYLSGYQDPDNGAARIYDIIYPQIYDLSSLGITDIKINGKQVKKVTVLNLSNLYFQANVSSSNPSYDLFSTNIVNTMYTMLGFPRLSNNLIGRFDVLTTDEILSTTYAKLRIPIQPTVYSKNRWGKVQSNKSWVSDLITDVNSTEEQNVTLACSTSSEGTIAYRIPSEFTGYGKDIYIEYRGENGIYETKYKEYYCTSTSYLNPYYTGYCSSKTAAKNGLLVYEANDASDNTSATTQDGSIIWVYRDGDTAKLFTESDGNIYIGLSNGTVIHISSISQATGNKSVSFKLEVINNLSAKSNLAESNGKILLWDNYKAEDILKTVTYDGIPYGTEFYNHTPTYTAVIKNKKGTTLAGSDYVTTGCYMEITSGTNVTKNPIIIGTDLGDMSGDGKHNILDVIIMKKIISDGESSNNLIADLNNDNVVDKIDLMLLCGIVLSKK